MCLLVGSGGNVADSTVFMGSAAGECVLIVDEAVVFDWELVLAVNV